MTPSKSHGQLYDITVHSNCIPHKLNPCGEVTMSSPPLVNGRRSDSYNMTV